MGYAGKHLARMGDGWVMVWMFVLFVAVVFVVVMRNQLYYSINIYYYLNEAHAINQLSKLQPC